MAQKRDIKYLNRNFDSFRGQLIEFSKNYFPDTYNDFSPTSPGMMFIEMASYVGDVLSFYQDTQIQESFIQYAQNPSNLYNLAYMMGYRPKVTSTSRANIQFSYTVPATGILIDGPPDFSVPSVIEQGAQLQASDSSNTIFLTERTVDFSYSSSFDPTTIVNNLNGTYNLIKNVPAFSGEVRTLSRTFNTYERFSTITIDDTDIIGILDILDEQNDNWYEVPFLGQETVFVEKRNTNLDAGSVYNSLELIKADKRFTTRFNSNGQLVIQFGSGVNPSDDTSFTPSTSNVGLGTSTGISRLDYAYDPTNFLYTRTYGLAPTGTLTIRYLVGGGVQSNVPANTITNLLTPSSVTAGDINLLSFTNPQPASGGSDGDSIEELRQNALRAFNEQGRTVTLQDFQVRVYSLPSTLGSVSKVFATQEEVYSTNSTTDSIIDSNPLAISLYVLAYDINGKLTTATTTLKENLKKYLSQYVLLTDSVNIRDAFIVNIGVEYEIITYPNVVNREILLECNRRLTEYFSTVNSNINTPINLSEVYTLLDRVKGVQSARNIKITNINGTLNGRSYSQYAYDVEGATRNNIVYPSLDPSIFEVKFPEFDIKGRIVNL
jgi:hypothetical protein